MKNYDVIIVGAGIMGLTVAYEYLEIFGKKRIAVFDKESDVAQHASGLNSGVIHSGIYYGKDSFKAKFCLDGNRALKRFCKDNNIPVNHCGKLIVAKDETELQALQYLYQQGLNNQASLSLVDEDEAHEIEPNVKLFERAIWSPETASVDPVKVCQCLKMQLKQNGVDFYFNYHALSINSTNKKLVTDKGEFGFGFAFNCAGLYADALLNDEHVKNRYQLIPFKGSYLKPKENVKLRTNVYPVPDSSFPFLGVHFTLTANNQVKLGPTAAPAFWREQYGGLRGFNLSECLSISKHLMAAFIRNHYQLRTLARREFMHLFKVGLLKEAQSLTRLMLTKNNFKYGRSGIRAQLINVEKKRLVNDFVFHKDDVSLHVLNAVSPAFTCSFSVAKYLLGTIS